MELAIKRNRQMGWKAYRVREVEPFTGWSGPFKRRYAAVPVPVRPA